MSKAQQEHIRIGLSIYPDITVMPGNGKICVVHAANIKSTVNAENMMKLIGLTPYQTIPANLRPGYHIIYIL